MFTKYVLSRTYGAYPDRNVFSITEKRFGRKIDESSYLSREETKTIVERLIREGKKVVLDWSLTDKDLIEFYDKTMRRRYLPVITVSADIPEPPERLTRIDKN